MFAPGSLLPSPGTPPHVGTCSPPAALYVGSSAKSFPCGHPPKSASLLARFHFGNSSMIWHVPK
eukprot:14639226-Alexandrium_andersonii.AAC.1